MNKTTPVYYSFNFVAHVPEGLTEEEEMLEAAKVLRSRINGFDDEAVSNLLEEYDRGDED